ncbi:ribosome-associated chaperone zuotin [Tubulinosema ratisbonensis]|uniref:Ribosome-associated chaperone zuotin n=1 Tax=Tubulinosema ratisbonensis TaxID=291195 RepID=A0A437ALS5_9MICR|nr:ribosome-associated chaperone zuotin [Tubulinosema ratisbonensis]
MMLQLYYKSEDIQEKERKYKEERNICKKYTLEELKNWRKLDLYFLLDLDSFREKEIPQNVLDFVFKKQIKRYHPDRHGTPKEALFAIQNAYKTLGNPNQRKKFDSVFFDESIPEDRKYDLEEFLEVFGECFKRNAKFSVKQPVPSLGNKDSSREEISEFYIFWENFSSWRIFNFLFETDVTMTSYERRDEEKKIKNQLHKLKVADNLRIIKLVQIALKRDPRINVTKESTVDKRLIGNGWNEEEIECLIKLLNDFKVGEKNRFDNITKKFNDSCNKKRNSKEIFLKSNQINNLKK